MAGEIQLNGTSFASESSGTITVNNGTLGSGVVFPTGTFLQVAQNQFNDQRAITSTSFNAFGDGTPSTAVTATINNCTTGNKILILLSVTFGNSALEYSDFRLVDTTNSNATIGTEGTDGLIGRLQVASTYVAYSQSISVLYTPPAFSSGSLTVELYGKSPSGTLYLNSSSQGTSNHASSLTLIEVQG
jgi:hypothetical protein